MSVKINMVALTPKEEEPLALLQTHCHLGIVSQAIENIISEMNSRFTPAAT